MIDALKRLQLQRRGLSCGKTRRKQIDGGLVEVLRFSPWVKILVFLGFVLGLVWISSFPPVEGALFGDNLSRRIAIVVVLFVVALVQFYANHPNSFRRNSRVVLIFGLVLLQVAMVKGICVAVQTNLPAERSNFAYLLIPYALGPMALSVLLGRAQGILVAVFTALWSCLVVPAAVVFPFLVTGLVCGFVGVYVTGHVRRRSRLVRAGFYVGITALVLTLAFGFLELPVTWPENPGEWQLLGFQFGAVLLVGTFTAMVVSEALPILESLFNVTTEISWMELSDLNHPLLKQMTLVAPGTYHHSLVVANLSEAAAEAVGANATQCRVCSYLHDIGKLAKPEYYIENVSDGHNPHDDLTPTMSTLVIIAHVKDGVDLALKHKLNSEIIDVIEQHHGTSLVYYFYRRALDQQEKIRREVEQGKANEEDVPEVEEKQFRYPGPKPRTREAAIISLADAVESASRTLAKPTPAKIEQLIEEIALGRFRDGQFEDCDLTFSELELIKKSFSTTLRSMMHNRIQYPKGQPEAEARRMHEEEKTEYLRRNGAGERPSETTGNGAAKPEPKKKRTTRTRVA